MSESVILPDRIDQEPLGASATAAPSRTAVARDAVLRMLSDEDVRALPQTIQDALTRFALEIALSVRWTPSVRIAVFGDAEDGFGEIVVSDRSKRREMQVTVRDEAAGDFWIRGDRDKVQIPGVTIESVPFVVTRFEAL